MTNPGQIRVILIQDGETWMAQCLEHDIGAQAKDLDTLQSLLTVAIQAEMNESIRRHGKPFAGIEPAPKSFFDLWEKRAGEYKPSSVSPIVKGDGHRVQMEMARFAIAHIPNSSRSISR